MLVGALLAAIDGREHDGDGGWKDLIDEAIARLEYVDVVSIAGKCA